MTLQQPAGIGQVLIPAGMRLADEKERVRYRKAFFFMEGFFSFISLQSDNRQKPNRRRAKHVIR